MINEIKEKILDEIRYGDLNNDNGLLPTWLNKPEIPHHAEYMRCFQDGVTCKQYTDAVIVKNIFKELEKAYVPDTNVGEWKRTAEEKPDYTRHVIITYGSSRHASKYGYYFKKEDKWYRDHRCIEEIEPPYAWTEMPEVPDEFICGVCCG